MSESSTRPVSGDDAARTVRGFSAAADCIALGELGPAVRATLSTLCGGAGIARVDDLGALAQRAAAGSGPLVLAAAGLDLDLPATLDLLDSPADRTAVLLADPRNVEAPRQDAYGLDRATLARVAPDRIVESVGIANPDPCPPTPEPLAGAASTPAAYTVGDPNRVVVGLLRIREADRDRAAELWRAAAASAAPKVDLFDLALLVLVRGGLPVGEQALGYYRWSRDGVGQRGLGATGWDQRLRSASRLGDGAYSAAVVRRLSRIGTRFALRSRLPPNLITAISLAVGVIAALLIFTGNPVAWIVAAVLLQLALIIDCMDGEVARYTRRYSAFGGWLDGIGDRVKEYLVFAAAAAVAVRDHHGYGWLLAIIAMVVVTARHLEDFSYTDRNAPDQAGKPALVPIGRSGDGSPEGTRTTLAAEPSRSARISFWARKIAHVPIAERYLVLSLMLLTLRPVWVLVAAIAVSGFALLWTVGGRLLRALRPGRAYRTPSLDQQLDLGLLAYLSHRLNIPYLPGMIILIISWLGLIAAVCLNSPAIASGWAVVAVIVAGAALRVPVTHRLGWLSLPLVWIAEGAVISSLLSAGVSGALIFGTVAAVAYRRYELIYSIRLRGLAGPRSLLGADGRILAVGVLFTASALTNNPDVLTWGLVALIVETLAEAVLGTAIRWGHRN